jgi:hypothetical protein
MKKGRLDISRHLTVAPVAATENPRLYETAKQMALDAGLAWLDPTTGILTVHLSREMRAKAERKAKELNCTVSELIEHLLELAVARLKRKRTP